MSIWNLSLVSTIVYASTGISALCFTFIPLLGAWGLLSLSFGLFLSHERWLNSDAFPLPESPTLDFHTKLFFFGTILGLGLLFSFFHSFLIVVGIPASYALSAFFMTECIIKPQQALNRKLKATSEALKVASAANNQEECARLEEQFRELLARGAEPLDGQYEKIAFLAIFDELNAFGEQTFSTHMKNWYNALKPLFYDRSVEHRIAFTDASTALFDAIMKPLTAMFNKAILYLQQQTYAEHQPEEKRTLFEKKEDENNEFDSKLDSRKEFLFLNKLNEENILGANDPETSKLSSPGNR